MKKVAKKMIVRHIAKCHEEITSGCWLWRIRVMQGTQHNWVIRPGEKKTRMVAIIDGCNVS